MNFLFYSVESFITFIKSFPANNLDLALRNYFYRIYRRKTSFPEKTIYNRKMTQLKLE